MFTAQPGNIELVKKHARKQAEGATGQAEQRHVKTQAVKQAEEKVLANVEVAKKNFKNAFGACLDAKDYSIKRWPGSWFGSYGSSTTAPYPILRFQMPRSK
ncbi:MAG: hypothetical protein P8Z30_05180 [Acidobacteriota bacterium]